MRRGSIAVAALVLSTSAAATPEGRWEGRLRVPERALPFVLDLARVQGGWSGSVIVTGLGVKGAPVAHLEVGESDVAFDLGSALTLPGQDAATVRLRLAGNALEGELRQAGNVAPLRLVRTGDAQVEEPPRSTSIGRTLEARWTGEYELGGYPRRVTLELRNDGPAGTAQWTIVGKQTTRLPVDLVVQDGEFVRVEARSFGAAFEGRLVPTTDELRGTIELGALEIPLVLRRAGSER